MLKTIEELIILVLLQVHLKFNIDEQKENHRLTRIKAQIHTDLK